MSCHRPTFWTFIVVLIAQYLFIQFKSLQSILKVLEIEFGWQENDADVPFSCSWTPPRDDATNRNMDWSHRHYYNIFRRYKNNNNTNITSDQPFCPEHDLLKAAVPFYIYPQQQIFSDRRFDWENVTDNDLSQNPKVDPAYHRVDARYENYILQALFRHPLRVENETDAELCIVPVPFGALCFDTVRPDRFKRRQYDEIALSLLKAKSYQQGKPHALISMTNPIFDYHRVKHVNLGTLLHQAMANMSVALSQDQFAARYIYMHHVTPTDTFSGFGEHFSRAQPVTEYTFSVGLGGQAMDLPLRIPTWEKFQNSSLFLFYHTRTSPPFLCDSGRFREAPVNNVSTTALPPSSVGWTIPWEQWNRELTDSKFCLVMRGDTPHSHSLFNAVKVGCLPVVISDWYPFYAPPFPATLDMRDFCIFISEGDFWDNPEKALTGLREIADDMIQDKLRALQWAQRVMMVDHPDSLFVPAFLREAMNSFSRPKSELFSSASSSALLRTKANKRAQRSANQGRRKTNESKRRAQ